MEESVVEATVAVVVVVSGVAVVTVAVVVVVVTVAVVIVVVVVIAAAAVVVCSADVVVSVNPVRFTVGKKVFLMHLWEWQQLFRNRTLVQLVPRKLGKNQMKRCAKIAADLINRNMGL